MIDTADWFVIGVCALALGFLALGVLRLMCAQVNRERREQHPPLSISSAQAAKTGRQSNASARKIGFRTLQWFLRHG